MIKNQLLNCLECRRHIREQRKRLINYARPWTACPCASCLMLQGSGVQTHRCGGGQRSPRCHGSWWPPPGRHGWRCTAPTGEQQEKHQDTLFSMRIDWMDIENTTVSVYVCVSVYVSVSVCSPLSEPGSSSASGRVLGNQERWLCPDPGSAAACCLSLCRFLSSRRQHYNTTSDVKHIFST